MDAVILEDDASSEVHSRKNARVPANQALETTCRRIESTAAAGCAGPGRARCAFGCVYEEAVAEKKVVDALAALAHPLPGRMCRGVRDPGRAVCR